MLSELKRRMSDTTDENSALLPVISIVVLGSFGFMLNASTHVYLVEQSVCREYYRLHEPGLIGRNGLVNEAICKIPQIQSRVAEILGVYKVLTYLPALFMAGPYGMVAGKIGKKPVMLMNLISYSLAGAYFAIVCKFNDLPIRAV
ncbi:hypothetical protein ONS96_011055 [Cadophora gregata f. sp. sojae]|nr:hypothetical protein ONS96_011055 [Cadophora gregata f. sp. sojae]